MLLLLLFDENLRELTHGLPQESPRGCSSASSASSAVDSPTPIQKTAEDAEDAEEQSLVS